MQFVIINNTVNAGFEQCFLPVSGWSDNKIRAYSPQIGKLMYTINDAHNKGVTAIATTSDGQKLISGGGEGQVRVWLVTQSQQTMKEAMKEHKGKKKCWN